MPSISVEMFTMVKGDYGAIVYNIISPSRSFFFRAEESSRNVDVFREAQYDFDSGSKRDLGCSGSDDVRLLLV